MQFVYVSAVKGRLVTRFPTLQAPAPQYIGATRHGKKITWDEDAVIPIPESEWRQYRREYRKALDSGSLKERTPAEFEAWKKSRQADNEKVKAECEARAKEDRAKANKAAEEVAAKPPKSKQGKALKIKGDS